METEAKNFRGSYPLAGERIGPAWRQIWKLMDQSSWLIGHVLADQIAPALDLSQKTVENLLRKAADAGQLEKSYVKRSGRTVAIYRARLLTKSNRVESNM